MEQDEHGLEEGEIQDDDEVHIYTPLERPQNYALDIPQKRFPEVSTQYSDSEEELQSSDSDSDSDVGPQRSKKPKKIKPTPKPLQRQDKVKKYDIWSTRAQEDVLAETMNICDVTIKDRSRDVETYDFSLARKYYKELEDRQCNKRTRDDRRNINFKPKKRSNSQEKDIKGKSRLIADLNVDVTCNIEEIAKEVANKLCEEREDLILKVLDAMGKEKTIDIFNETKRIEAEGGMLIMNQTRRRTPGGVFLFLVRHDYHITPEQKQKIFDEDKQRYNRMVKERKKKKLLKLKMNNEEARSKLLPDLLTRAELLAKQNPIRKLKETDDANCTNPPPSPETDAHESGDGMDPSPTMESQPLMSEPPMLNHCLNSTIESSRGKLKTYDDDFLDIGGENDMDLF